MCTRRWDTSTGFDVRLTAAVAGASATRCSGCFCVGVAGEEGRKKQKARWTLKQQTGGGDLDEINHSTSLVE